MLARLTVEVKLINIRRNFPKWCQIQPDAHHQTPYTVGATINQLDQYGSRAKVVEVFMEIFDCSNEEWQSAKQDLADFCGCGEIFRVDDRLVMARLLDQWLKAAKSEYGECDAEMEYIQLSLLSVTENSLIQARRKAFITLCRALACLAVCAFILSITVEMFGLKIQGNTLHMGVLVGVAILMIVFSISVLAIVFSTFVYGKTERSLKNFLTRVGRRES